MHPLTTTRKLTSLPKGEPTASPRSTRHYQILHRPPSAHLCCLMKVKPRKVPMHKPRLFLRKRKRSKSPAKHLPACVCDPVLQARRFTPPKVALTKASVSVSLACSQRRRNNGWSGTPKQQPRRKTRLSRSTKNKNLLLNLHRDLALPRAENGRLPSDLLEVSANSVLPSLARKPDRLDIPAESPPCQYKISCMYQ